MLRENDPRGRSARRLSSREADLRSGAMIFRAYQQMKKMLSHLDQWLEKAEAHAKTKGFDGKVLVAARLAPDQFPLARQIQSACDTAKLSSSRLTGKQAPANPDTEETIAELRQRIQSTIAWVDSLAEGDFAKAETATITNPRWEGKTMLGVDYFHEHAIPNFYFHLAHAYAILRHNGVDVGKRDYLGPMTMQG